MKTKTLLRYALIGIIFFSTSCEKNFKEPVKTEKLSTRDKIVSFVKDIESKNKSLNSQTYTIEDGLWGVESGIALYRTRLNLNYENTVRLEKHFKCNIGENNEIAFSDLQKLYYEILNKMEKIWYFYEGENKAYNLISVKYQENEEYNVTVSLKFSYGSKNKHKQNRSVNNSYWIYGDYDTYSFSTGIFCEDAPEIGADDIICSEIYLNHLRFEDASVVALDPIRHDILYEDFPNPDYDESNPNYYEYMLFYSTPSDPNYHTCLSKQEVINYVSLTWKAINKTEAEGYFKPAGYDVVDLELTGSCYVGYHHSPNFNAMFHSGSVFYGKIHKENWNVIGF